MAREVLGSIRADQVAQAVGRYARDSVGSGATDSVWSSTIPDSNESETTAGIIQESTGLRQKTLEAVSEIEYPITNLKVREETGECQQTTYRHLQGFVESGILQEQPQGEGKATPYTYLGGDFTLKVDLGRCS